MVKILKYHKQYLLQCTFSLSKGLTGLEYAKLTGILLLACSENDFEADCFQRHTLMPKTF